MSFTDNPPLTGHGTIDQALADLGDLSRFSAAEQLERLTVAQEVLSRVLETSRESVQTPIPGFEATPNTSAP